MRCGRKLAAAHHVDQRGASAPIGGFKFADGAAGQIRFAAHHHGDRPAIEHHRKRLSHHADVSWRRKRNEVCALVVVGRHETAGNVDRHGGGPRGGANLRDGPHAAFFAVLNPQHQIAERQVCQQLPVFSQCTQVAEFAGRQPALSGNDLFDCGHIRIVCVT